MRITSIKFLVIREPLICIRVGSVKTHWNTNERLSYDIDGLAGKEEELASLVDHVDKISAAFDMEISAEKTKVMTNNATGISIDIKINGEKLGEVDSFKCLGAVVTDQGFKPEVLSRIAQTTAALATLKTMLLRGGGQGVFPGYFERGPWATFKWK